MTEHKKKLAFYDFAVSPYSYDFAQFVLCARAAECTGIVVVPGDRKYQKCTPEEQEYRLKHLILGIEPGAHVCQTREEAAALWHEGCFPEGYTVETPVASHTVGHVVNALKIFPIMPTDEKKKEVEADGLFGPNLVTITIRDTHIKPERNSDVPEWVKAADWLRLEGFDVVFIPDTEKPDEKFGSHQSSKKAALDVQYRLALYEAACLNLGVNNGPMALCFYSRRPMLYFRPLCPVYPETSQQGWAKAGIGYRSQPAWFTHLQRIIWDGGDDFDNIRANVELWMKARRGEEAWPASIAPTYPIRGVSDPSLRHGQMSAAMEKAREYGFSMLKRTPHHEGTISIVCYGPSLKDTWRFIPRPIMTVSGAHDFLIERGVIPDYHLDCDPREHKIQMLTPHAGVKYLMASVCHPSAWDKLRGHEVKLWHLHNGAETDDWLRENDTKNAPIGGGTTAGSRAFQVAEWLGFVRFNVFGMDCSYESETKRHAGGHLGKTQKPIHVLCNGKEFISSPQMVEAARETMVMIQNYEVFMYFHGDGLQQEMVRAFRSRFGVVERKYEKFIHPPAPVAPMKEVANG